MEQKRPATPPRTGKTPPPLPPKKDGFVPDPTATSNAEVVKTANRPKFVKGNQLWQMVTNAGAPAIITDAAELWQKAIDYFNWCDANPQVKAEPVKHQGEGFVMDMPLGRPYSMNALTVFTGVSIAYFRTRESEIGNKEEAKTATEAEIALLGCIRLIKEVVRAQRFEGAAVGIFKENLIARIDGYADNINQHNTGEVRQNIIVRDTKTADDLAKLDDMLK